MSRDVIVPILKVPVPVIFLRGIDGIEEQLCVHKGGFIGDDHPCDLNKLILRDKIEQR